MKLRLTQDSIRLRFNQSEVSQLARGESLEQSTDFSPISRFITRIECTGTQLRAEFDSSRLTIHIPQQNVTYWANSEEPGIEAAQPSGPGRTLKILIEKDFQCLHKTPEAGAFPNPAKR